MSGLLRRVLLGGEGGGVTSTNDNAKSGLHIHPATSCVTSLSRRRFPGTTGVSIAGVHFMQENTKIVVARIETSQEPLAVLSNPEA